MNRADIKRAISNLEIALTCFIFIAVSIGCHTSNAATVIFNNGLESGTLSGFKCSGNCPTVTSSPVASGTKAISFDLTRSMSTNYRTEATLQEPAGQCSLNQECWYGWDMRFQDYAKDSDPETAMQIHLVAPAGGKPCAESAMGTAPFLLITQNDILAFKTYGNKTQWTQPLKKGVWQKAVFRFIPSTGASGLIEAWIDGVKVASVNGTNIDPLDGCGVPYRQPQYLKIGIYKWNWKRGPTQSARRLLIIDNVKVAIGANGYGDVSGAPVVPDTTKPVISNVQSSVTDTTATITWNTDESSDSVVNYGLTTAYGTNSSSASFVTTHSRTLTGLQPNTPYHYRVNSKDPSNNNQTSGDFTFTTANSPVNDVTPPIISNVQAISTANSITVSWTTNEASNSLLQSGETISYGTNTPNSNKVTAHSVTVNGLSPGTLYHYRVSSTDNSSNTATSPDFTISTQPSTDTTDPIIDSIAYSCGSTSCTVQWETNEDADSLIRYGFDTSYGNIKSNPARNTLHSLDLTGLDPSKDYHIKIESRDASGNLGSSDDITVTTTGASSSSHSTVIRTKPDC